MNTVMSTAPTHSETAAAQVPAEGPDDQSEIRAVASGRNVVSTADPDDSTNRDQTVNSIAPPSSRSIQMLTILALAYSFYVARAILFPVVLAMILAALMRPVVRWLHRRHVPEFAGAILVIGCFVALSGYGATWLVEPAKEWFQNPDEKLQQIERRLQTLRQPIADLEDVADKVEEAASGAVADKDKPVKVTVQQPSLVNSVISSTGQMLAGAAITLVLLYFLLIQGNTLLRQVVMITPTRRGKRDAVELVRKIEQGVSAYLLQVTFINACLGVVIGLTMWMIGLPTPALWGTLAALLNFFPYVGGLAGATIVFFVGVLTFESLPWAFVAPLAYFCINTIEGNFITPALLGRRMSLNPIFVFLSLTFWGWIWGLGGAILAVPLLAVMKISCEQFESLHPMAVLLSGDPIAETSHA